MLAPQPRMTNGATNELATSSVTLAASNATCANAPTPVPTAVPMVPSTKTSLSTALLSFLEATAVPGVSVS